MADLLLCTFFSCRIPKEELHPCDMDMQDEIDSKDMCGIFLDEYGALAECFQVRYLLYF